MTRPRNSSLVRRLAGPLTAAFVTATTVLALSPSVARDPANTVLGGSGKDFYSVAWGLDHVARAVLAGHLPSPHTDAMAWPDGATLLVADLPEAILLAPAVAAWGPAVGFNLLALLHHALAAAAAWWCGRRVGLGAIGAAVMAAAFASAPAMLSSTWNGNPDVTAWYWVPIVAGLSAGRPSWRAAALAGLAASAAAWCNLYAGAMAVIALVVLLAGRPWTRLAAALGAWVGPTAAWLALTVATTRAPDSVVKLLARRDPLDGPATLLDLVQPAVKFQVSPDIDDTWASHWGYLGLVLLLAGALGLWRARLGRWSVLAAVALLVALGPQIALPGGASLPSPYALVEAVLGDSVLKLNYRFTALAVLALAVGAGWLAERRPRVGWLLVFLILGDVLVLSGGHRLLDPHHVFDDGSCEVLRGLEPGPVIDLPASAAELWLFASTCHGMPVAEGINQALPPSVMDQLLDEDRLPIGTAQAGRVLQQAGYRWLVYHEQTPRSTDIDIPELPRMARWCLQSRSQAGAVVIDLPRCRFPLPDRE